jgi:hypothetical protein
VAPKYVVCLYAKKEDELHIYDTYRAYLQTQEEFTLEIKIMKSKVGIISHRETMLDQKPSF